MTMRYAHSLFTDGHSETFGMFSLRSDKLQPRTNPVETHYKNSLFALTLTKMLTIANLKTFSPSPIAMLFAVTPENAHMGCYAKTTVQQSWGGGW